jgi:hypothetical protein
MAQSETTMVVPPFWVCASGGGHGWANPDLLHDQSESPHIIPTRKIHETLFKGLHLGPYRNTKAKNKLSSG